MKSNCMNLHHENGTFSPELGFITSLALLTVGVVTGETTIPLHEFLQDGAYLCTMLVAIGTMFKVNYKALVLDMWKRIKNELRKR